MSTLGQVLRTRRIELGLTQEELAELIGGSVRQAEISRLENDYVTLPRRERLERIAEVLEIPLGVLLAHSGWVGADQELGSDARHGVPPAPHEEIPPETASVVIEKLGQVQELVEEVQALVEPVVSKDQPEAPVPMANRRALANAESSPMSPMRPLASLRGLRRHRHGRGIAS